MDILMRTLLGFIGILLYALLTAKDKSETDTLSVKDYLVKSWVKWIISLMIIIVLAVYLEITGDSGTALQTATGLAFTTELTSFATLGYILVSAGRKIGN